MEKRKIILIVSIAVIIILLVILVVMNINDKKNDPRAMENVGENKIDSTMNVIVPENIEGKDREQILKELQEDVSKSKENMNEHQKMNAE